MIRERPTKLFEREIKFKIHPWLRVRLTLGLLSQVYSQWWEIISALPAKKTQHEAFLCRKQKRKQTEIIKKERQRVLEAETPWFQSLQPLLIWSFLHIWKLVTIISSLQTNAFSLNSFELGILLLLVHLGYGSIAFILMPQYFSSQYLNNCTCNYETQLYNTLPDM